MLRVLFLAGAVAVGGFLVMGHLNDSFHWPLRRDAASTLERARQRGADIRGKTAAAASKIVARTAATATRIGDKTSAAATRISDKTSATAAKIGAKTTVAATKIGEKTTVTATKVEHALNETAVSAKIKAKMALDDDINARAIDVSTQGTTVTLSGTVASKGERARAVSLARETAGVTRVIDDLRTP